MSAATSTIDVHSKDLRNTSMNIRGMDLKFDEHGVSHGVPFNIARLIAPMHNFRLDGLTEEQQEEVENYVQLINSQRKNEQNMGRVRFKGLGTKEKDTRNVFVKAIAAGRIPKSVQARIDKAEAASASESEVEEADVSKSVLGGKAKKKSSRN